MTTKPRISDASGQPAPTAGEPSAPPLHWEIQDIERKLCFAGEKYTDSNTFLTFLMSLVLTTAFYVGLAPFYQCYFAQMFFERGAIPYLEMWMASWSLAILLIKWRKVALQTKALDYSITRDEVDFVLSPKTANDILEEIYKLAHNPKHFLLFNRIERALSNLKHIGRVSDVEDILRSQADNDESSMESTYTLVRGFIWAIPVLGFIGTVQGLSTAIGGFGVVLSKATDISELRGSLQVVTGGLAVAFETTFIALVAAVIIQLLLTALKRKEEAFLDRCSEYCHRHIVSKLRTLSVDEDQEIEGAP